jgi:hypothetical protein
MKKGKKVEEFYRLSMVLSFMYIKQICIIQYEQPSLSSMSAVTDDMDEETLSGIVCSYESMFIIEQAMLPAIVLLQACKYAVVRIRANMRQ